MNLKLVLAFSAIIVLCQGLNILPQVEQSESEDQGLQSLSQPGLPVFNGEYYSGLTQPRPYAPRRKSSEVNPTHPGLLPPPVETTRPPSKCCWIWSCDPPMDSKSHPAGLISCVAI